MSQAPSSILVPLDLSPGASAIDYSGGAMCPILGFLVLGATGVGEIKLTPLNATAVEINIGATSTGTGARLRVTADARGQLTGVEVASAGSGYDNGTLTTTLHDPYGTGGAISVTISGGAATGATVTSAGLNYSGYITMNISDLVDGVNYNIVPRFIEQVSGAGTIALLGNRLSYRPFQVF